MKLYGSLYLHDLSYYTHIPCTCNLLNKAYMYNKFIKKIVAELGMGRIGYGPSLYGPSWVWAELVMGRVCMGRVGYGPSLS